MSALLEERYPESAQKKGFILDTGVLLIHALGVFEDGKYLSQACGFLKEKNKDQVARNLFGVVTRLMASSGPNFITPHALTEFFALVEGKLGLNGREVSDLLLRYHEVLMNLSDVHLEKNDLLASEQLSKFGIADVAGTFATNLKNSILLTTDYPLTLWCRGHDLLAWHIYYDVYLLS